MELVQIIGIIFAAAVILVLAYLYRESQRISDKTKVEAGPSKVVSDGAVPRETEPESADK